MASQLTPAAGSRILAPFWGYGGFTDDRTLRGLLKSGVRVDLFVDAFAMYSEFGMEHEITVHDFQALRSRQHAVSSEYSHQFCLLDVREPWEAEMAAIAGSHRMPMQEIPSRAQQELHPDAHIVVYCHHGRRSLNVVMWLREQGFSKSQSLAGGIDAWSQTIDPSIPRY